MTDKQIMVPETIYVLVKDTANKWRFQVAPTLEALSLTSGETVSVAVYVLEKIVDVQSNVNIVER